MRALQVIVLSVGLIGFLSFMIRYHVRTRGDWIRNPGGRLLMMVNANLTALISLMMVNRLLPGWDYREQMTLVLISVFVIQVFSQHKLMRYTDKEVKTNGVSE